MSIKFYSQCYIVFVMSVPNKFCLQQTTVLRCVLISTFNVRGPLCSAMPVPQTTSILSSQTWFGVFVSQVNYISTFRLVCRVRKSPKFYTTNSIFYAFHCILSCVNLTWHLLNLCCAVRESHVISILNFTLSSPACAPHVTSILSFTLCSSVYLT